MEKAGGARAGCPLDAMQNGSLPWQAVPLSQAHAGDLGDHLHNFLSGFRDEALVVEMGLLLLQELLLGIFLEPLVQRAQALRRARRAVYSNGIVAIGNNVPALVFFHYD